MNNYRQIVVLAWALSACAPTAESEGNEAPGIAITQWTAKMEIFMEYPAMVMNVPGKFVIHLTRLGDFEPVRTGQVTLQFTHEKGQVTTVVQEELLREGIFNPVTALPEAGAYTFTIAYQSADMAESFVIPDFVVHPSLDSIAPEDDDGGGIGYLKEQQWKTAFATTPIAARTIRASLRVSATVRPDQRLLAKVMAPIDGVLIPSDNARMANPGQKVAKGEKLATIGPSLSASNTWAQRRMSYEHAEEEYQRAQRLSKKEAISDRELDNARRKYLAEKGAFEKLSGLGTSDQFPILSPINGTVLSVNTVLGEEIKAGDHLFNIVGLDRVWLDCLYYDMSDVDYSNLSGLLLQSPDQSQQIIVLAGEFRIIDPGTTYDLQSGARRLIISVDNRLEALKPGQRLIVDLFTSASDTTLAVPVAAIIHEDEGKVVFIHSDGETFRKVPVITGAEDLGWIAVQGDFTAGDRVVSIGAYQVKLASTSAAIGHPHAH